MDDPFIIRITVQHYLPARSSNAFWSSSDSVDSFGFLTIYLSIGLLQTYEDVEETLRRPPTESNKHRAKYENIDSDTL